MGLGFRVYGLGVLSVRSGVRAVLRIWLCALGFWWLCWEVLCVWIVLWGFEFVFGVCFVLFGFGRVDLAGDPKH